MSTGYFARLYDQADDPWGLRTRWYEKRKRDVTLSLLTRPRYERVFEPGCSVGVLTADLAARSREVVAVDVEPRALAAAAAAVAGRPGVDLRRMSVPEEWPPGSFDLVVVSELGYYLGEQRLALLLDRAVGALRPEGALLLCHWRHPVNGHSLRGDDVHERARRHPGLVVAAAHGEEDFRADLLTRGVQASPARVEGLLT